MPAQRVDRPTFLGSLKASGLLTEQELALLLRGLPRTNRGRVVARHLVERGILTRFQAERLLAGRTQGFLLDKYVILDHLGKGGMGQVYKARDRTMNRVVALKVLANHLVKTERARELFRREVEAVGNLQHPNVVTAFDANQVGDRYFLVLEFVDGPNLDQLVRQQGPLKVGQACDYVRQIAQGLQAAHARGMVHRDIKPANALLQPHGVEGEHTAGLVKIGDFGLARLQTPTANEKSSRTILTSPKKVMGTPDFLSPEQARDMHSADIRSDIYSLGCTFYFLLTGSVPYPKGTAMDKLIRHSTAEPRPVEAFRTDVPTEVQGILRKMIAKKPEDRFQTPSDLSTALDPWSVSGPTPWEPPVLFSPELSVDESDAPANAAFESEDSELYLELIEGPSAMTATVPPDGSPTPIIGHSSGAMRNMRRPQMSSAQKFLLWAIGLAITALAGAFLYHFV